MRPEPGLVLENPASGTRTTFTATAASTDGAYVEVESTYPPHGPRPPVHHHPSQTEEFTVLTGALTVVRDGETFVAEQGTSFSVAPGQRHQMFNEGDVEAVLRWRTSPALRTDEMFCAVWQVAHDHDWRPDPADVYEVVCGFAAEFQLG
ncbi:MAG: cupin domain-containing protein [Jatrophihabitans sp.]|uniref:cupin domain-containing protein n=1 Tax=Jatrophihabitans sp. TaxID=1932789 RepID=UPI003F7FD169